jgi:hypothetical protein
MTKVLFPIGVFPYVMIISTLIFFEGNFHKKILDFVCRIFRIKTNVFQGIEPVNETSNSSLEKFKLSIVALFLVFQILFPFRYLLYPGELFWTEEGYRFSWRVMLMEKAGYAQFYVTDAITKEKTLVNNSLFLSTFQEKQMATQPDFILEYAHYLHDYYKDTGINDPIITVTSYVALNGRLSQMYIDPKVNLAKEKDSFQHKNWLLPFNDEIKGF